VVSDQHMVLRRNAGRTPPQCDHNADGLSAGGAVLFLTELDPKVRVKGFRDPLGSQSVWSGCGRLVVGNLTTQTNSLDDFRVLLIGAWLMDRAVELGVPETNAFIVWEQLASYARAHSRQLGGFRGVTRVEARLVAKEPIHVSPERDHQTLTNQVSYGIWGLYSAAAVRCGMISRRAGQWLTNPEARRLMQEQYLPHLEGAWGPDARQLVTWTASGHTLKPHTQDHDSKLEAVAQCICDPLTSLERDFYWETLVEGGARNTGSAVFAGTTPVPVRRRQRVLADLLDATVPPGASVSRADVEQIEASTTDRDLGDRLEIILAVEAMLSLSISIFAYASQQPGARVSDVAAELEAHFSEASTILTPAQMSCMREVGRSAPELMRAVGDKGGATGRWLQIAEALHEQRWEDCVRLLIEQNAAVSRDRGASVGWLDVSARGTLDVRLAVGGYELPAAAEASRGWGNSYFLDNLLAMTRATRAA
jgi:hypothetical protein